LPEDAFHLPRAMGQPLMSNPALYFLIVFTIKLKRNNLRHELKKYMLKQALISLKYFRPLWVKLLNKKKIILNDRVFYFLSTAIVILIVIVIRINHYD
jgi:hypothetical protein